MLKKTFFYRSLLLAVIATGAYASESYKIHMGAGYGIYRTRIDLKNKDQFSNQDKPFSARPNSQTNNISGFLRISTTGLNNIFYAAEISVEDTSNEYKTSFQPYKNYSFSYKLKTGPTTNLNLQLGYDFGKGIVYAFGGLAIIPIEIHVIEEDKLEILNKQKQNFTLVSPCTIGVGGDYRLGEKITLGLKYNYTDFRNQKMHLNHCDGCISVNPRVHSVMVRVGIALN